MSRARLRPEAVAAIVVLALVAFVFLNVSSTNPPGFNRDEAAIAYNAYTLSQSGDDEYGAHLPLFIRSFGDYKSPLYVYLLAAVFRVTGPSVEAARTVGAVVGLAAVLVLYLLALAISRRKWIALAVMLLAGLGPWLFETSRIVYEVALMPLLLALLLLVVHRAGTGAWRLRHSLAIGLLLAALVYTYQVGRVVAPLFALALLVCWYRKWRQIAVVCAVFVVAAVVPLAVWAHAHPGALESRYHSSTYIVPGMSTWEIVWTYVRTYLGALNPWVWATQGDADHADHVPGDGSVFFVEAALAIAGIVVVLLRRRSDPWWRFLLLAVLISPVAAAVTVGSIDTRRMIVLGVLLPLLAIPALESIAALPAQRARMVMAALAVVFVAEAVHWEVVYSRDGPRRLRAFDVGSHALIAAAFRENRKVYAFRSDLSLYAEMLFDGAAARRSPSSSVVLDVGERPPAGASVLGPVGECRQCRTVLASNVLTTDNPMAEYVYRPAKPGVVGTSFQLTSPLPGVGGPLDFTVWVDNKGAKPADHLILTVELPPAMHLTGAPFFERGYGCSGSSQIVCNIGFLPAKSSTVVRYEVRLDDGGPQTMTASIGTDKLDVNTESSRAGFTVDLSPPVYARASPATG